MAVIHQYYWQQETITTRWHIAGYFLEESGYMDVPTFADAISAANPTILDWQNVVDGTIILIPYLS